MSEAARGPGSGPRRVSYINAAWGQWLTRYEWDHYLTLTFSREGTQQGARRAAARYLKRLAREVGGPVPFFWGTEYGGAGGRLHLHALTANTAELPYSELREAWPCGHAWVKRYSPVLGAAYYLTKYCTKDLSADYDLSPGLRPIGAPAMAGQGRLFHPASVDATRRASAGVRGAVAENQSGTQRGANQNQLLASAAARPDPIGTSARSLRSVGGSQT